MASKTVSSHDNVAGATSDNGISNTLIEEFGGYNKNYLASTRLTRRS